MNKEKGIEDKKVNAALNRTDSNINLDRKMTPEERMRAKAINIGDHSMEQQLAIMNKRSDRHYRWVHESNIRKWKTLGYEVVQQTDDGPTTIFSDPEESVHRVNDMILMETLPEVAKKKMQLPVIKQQRALQGIRSQMEVETKHVHPDVKAEESEIKETKKTTPF